MLLEYSSSNIILHIEMSAMKKFVIFCMLAWFPFFRSYWFVLRVALYLLPSSLFATTIRSDCTTRTKKEQAYRLRLEHFCDSHIQASVGATLRSTRLWRSLNRIFVKSKTSRNRNVKSQSSCEIRNTTVLSEFSTFLKIIKSKEQNFYG